MKNFENILWGLVLIGLGIIIGTNALGITNINIFFDGWWTLFIIVPCFIGLFKETEKTGNIIGLLIGTSLLLCSLNIIDFNLIWKLALPTVLVVIGLSFIFKDTLNRKVNDEIKKLNDKKGNGSEYCATFSSQNVNFDGEDFNGTDLTAVFGEARCDLTKAKIKRDVVINCSSIFGGISVYVPDNVKVKIKSTSIFGGVEEKSKKQVEDSNAHTIYINALCLFGGVDIK